MLSSPRRVFDHLLPSADELWERGGARMETRIADGYAIDVPNFPIDVTVDESPLKEELFRSKRGRLLGRSVVLRALASDGQRRLVRVNELNDTARDDRLDFFVSRGAAWFTGMNGYGRDRIDATSALLGVDTIQISAVGERSGLRDAYDTLRASQTHSLAKSAQTKQAIIDQLVDRFDLPKQQVATGCSMDDMETLGEIEYARTGSAPIIWHDGVAPCGLDDLAIEDLPKIARWIGYELSDIPALGVDALRHGRLGTLLKTVPLDPSFFIYSIVGNTPALASDEAGRMLEWLPQDTAGHQTIYLRDGMSGTAWTDALKRFPNIETKEVERRHLDLVRERARNCQLGRLACFGQQYSKSGGLMSEVDARFIARGKPELIAS